MNNFTCSGNLGRDAVLRHTNDGRPVLNFSVAVKTGYKQTDKDMWVGCSLFGKRAESLAQYLTTGTKVIVAGPCKLREWQDKTGVTRTNLDLICWEVTLMGSSEPQQSDYGHSGGYGHNEASVVQGGAQEPSEGSDFEDDIPF